MLLKHQNLLKICLFLSGCILTSLSKNSKDEYTIPSRLCNALSKLKKKHRDVVITKSDKTNQFVLLDKRMYQKMLDLLDDTSTCEKLLSHSLSRKVSTFNSKLSSVLHQHSDLVSKFKTIHPTLPYIYGLPKTHK